LGNEIFLFLKTKPTLQRGPSSGEEILFMKIDELFSLVGHLTIRGLRIFLPNGRSIAYNSFVLPFFLGIIPPS
jgi:hypothetical protein